MTEHDEILNELVGLEMARKIREETPPKDLSRYTEDLVRIHRENDIDPKVAEMCNEGSYRGGEIDRWTNSLLFLTMGAFVVLAIYIIVTILF
jgi:hypothetical protein